MECKDQTKRRLESSKTYLTLGVTYPKNFKNFPTKSTLILTKTQH